MSAAFPEPLPAKPGYELLKDYRLGTPMGGAIRLRGIKTRQYPVLAILKKKDEDIYLVVLRKDSDVPGYKREDAIEYSCSSFSNNNTINPFIIKDVDGPIQFKCSGPARLNV